MSLPRRALIAITSAKAELFEGGGHQTGVFIGEALHPYYALKKAGFEVDLASETGKWSEDWLSLTPGFLSVEERAQYDDPKSEFRSAIDNALVAGEVDGNKYGLFFASAGHAALIDYPHAKGLKNIAAKVWDNGGIVASVCHGPSIFIGLNDLKTGEPIIKGKSITGFCTEAEDVMKITDALRSWKEPLVEEIAADNGATYKRAPGIWDDFHVVDGRLVTGMNPASAKSTAEAAVEVFETL
ncbi:IgE-binging protein [Amniculicola lignicola CBS 123094]|uniref:D-lactate dehydratase n=1 Tax=Amniculicola lignicola CBS 123094 TaxID=1392246 RepID=A0A6A5W9X5_9PLEO|nr:IgE-binging protein [Amniculicola lignicola CBS 123094]